MPDFIAAHCGDLPASYSGPLTSEQRLDQMEMHIREKMECASGFADVEVQRRRLISLFKFFDHESKGAVNFTTFHATMVRMNFVGSKTDTEQLFARYDYEGTGEIDYSQFAHGVFQVVPPTGEASHELY